MDDHKVRSVTKRLLLRAQAVEDASAVFALNSSPEVVRFTHEPRLNSLEELLIDRISECCHNITMDDAMARCANWLDLLRVSTCDCNGVRGVVRASDMAYAVAMKTLRHGSLHELELEAVWHSICTVRQPVNANETLGQRLARRRSYDGQKIGRKLWRAYHVSSSFRAHSLGGFLVV